MLPLMVAYLSQVLLELHPCHFCLLQRYPYGVVIAAGLMTLTVPRMSLRWRFAVAVGVCGLLATGALGLIHSGIEAGLLHYSGGCVAQAASDNSLEALRASIMNAPVVSCSEVAASFLGLSMASWNVIWAACVLLLLTCQYRFELRRYDALHA